MRAFLYAQCLPLARLFFVRSIFLFTSHSEKLAISIRAPFFVRSVLFFWVCPMEHINCSSLHLTAIVHGGEQYFIQEDLLSHEYSPPRPSVSRTHSLSLGVPSF